MPKNVTDEERLTERLIFVTNKSMAATLLRVAKTRDTSYGHCLREAVQHWIDDGFPVPAVPLTDPNEEK